MSGIAAQKPILDRWLAWIARQPCRALILVLVFTVLAGLKIPMLTFSTSIRDLIVNNSLERQRYDAFKALFGTDEIIHVVVKGDDIFAPSFFTRLRYLSDAFNQIPGVSRVISLPQIKEAVDPQDQWPLERFAQMTAPVSIFQRNLISPDRRVSGITLILDDHADQAAVTRAVDLALIRLDEGYSGYQMGMPSVSIALARYAQQDFVHLPFYTILIIAAILLLMFKSVVEMALPLLCVAVADIWTLGAMAWCGISLNMLTVVVPVLLIAVGTAYCLYIFCEFRSCSFACEDAREALQKTYSRTAFPTLIAVCTTIAGIGSLMVTPIGAVRQFSGFACLGILAMLAAVLTFYPCLLVVAWPTIRRRRPNSINRLFPPVLVDKLVTLITGRRRTVFFVLAIFSMLAVVGILRIRVETNPLSYFRSNTPISLQFHDIYRHLSGSFPLHLEIRANGEDFFLSMTGLKLLADHQRFLETVPGVDKTLALADYLMLVNYVTNRFDPDYYALPQTDFEMRMLVNNFKSLLGRDILARYVSADFATANITMLTRLSSARAFMETEKMIRAYYSRYQNGETTCHVTGLGMIMSLGSHHLVVGQVWSLLITLGIIYALIHLMFLSVRIGAIAMMANLFPILVSFGAMGWLGIDLSMGTCLIASIVVGLSVDDTIHYLARYKRAYKLEMDPTAAMRTTLTQVGWPIVTTSMAISAGFSILMLSIFTPTAVFGLLMVLAMASAMSGGLLILPALLSKVSPITLEEVFQIRIGGDRLQQMVPLLKGMTRFQVHRILRAGKIRRIDAGNHLFGQGDVADCMYVVISGVFDAVMTESESTDEGDPRDDVPKRVNRLHVGDIIGEMGLMSSGYRCVAVIAVVSGEVLALNREHLARIRRIYPRTASRFFANLSTILSEKLIQADHCLSNECKLDDDTGLLNREAFLDCLEKEIDRARRFGDSMVVGLLDVCDRDGAFATHPLAVEHFICQAARVLSANFRKIDMLGRFDANTLVVLLARTTSAHSREICDRLKAAFRSQIPTASEINTTISCRFIDLDFRHCDDASGDIFDMVCAIRSVRNQKVGDLLYASSLEVSN